MLFKDFKAQETTQDKPIKFVASTATPDRYGDIVDQKGWDLSAYNRNPVVLFNHNPQQMPIGKGRAYVENDQLMLEVEFDQNDEMARKIEDKVRGGYISAVSVGFQPAESIPRSRLPADNPYHGKSGYYFAKSELLEVSIVTIPANNEATLSKQFTREIGLVDVARSLIINKHIVSIQELENGNILVEFAKEDMQEDQPVEDQPVEEPVQESMNQDEEQPQDEQAKAFDFDAFLAELKDFNQQ